jgi:hypothetical protein
MGATETIYRTCAGCGVTFGQPDDPGRKREYHDNACRQAAYRARGGRASGTRRESARARQRRAEQEAWAEQEARRERERQRSERRRRGQQQTGSGSGDDRWTWSRADDDPATAKRRRTCRLLIDRANHKSTPAAEAAACREKAATLRARYGL